MSADKFTEYLLETIKFARGKDNDFLHDSFAIITFNKGDINQYKVEGKTAGLWGHACKHLDEVDKEFVDNVISQVRNTLIDYVEQDNHPKAYEFNYFNDNRRKVAGDPLTLIKRASRASIINFLDLVNDKVQLNDDLSPIESKCVKYLKALGNRYGEHIENLINKAVSIDSLQGDQAKYDALNKQNVISFSIVGLGGNQRPMKIFLDIANDLIVIKTGQYVNTMYKVSYRGSGRRALLSAFNRKVMKNARFDSTSTYRAFNEYIGTK